MKFVNDRGSRLIFTALGLEVEAGDEFEVTDEASARSLYDQGFPLVKGEKPPADLAADTPDTSGAGIDAGKGKKPPTGESGGTAS